MTGWTEGRTDGCMAGWMAIVDWMDGSTGLRADRCMDDGLVYMTRWMHACILCPVTKRRNRSMLS